MEGRNEGKKEGREGGREGEIAEGREGWKEGGGSMRANSGCFSCVMLK